MRDSLGHIVSTRDNNTTVCRVPHSRADMRACICALLELVKRLAETLSPYTTLYNLRTGAGRSVAIDAIPFWAGGQELWRRLAEPTTHRYGEVHHKYLRRPKRANIKRRPLLSTKVFFQ